MESFASQKDKTIRTKLMKNILSIIFYADFLSKSILQTEITDKAQHQSTCAITNYQPNSSNGGALVQLEDFWEVLINYHVSIPQASNQKEPAYIIRLESYHTIQMNKCISNINFFVSIDKSIILKRILAHWYLRPPWSKTAIHAATFAAKMNRLFSAALRPYMT